MCWDLEPFDAGANERRPPPRNADQASRPLRSVVLTPAVLKTVQDVTRWPLTLEVTEMQHLATMVGTRVLVSAALAVAAITAGCSGSSDRSPASAGTAALTATQQPTAAPSLGYICHFMDGGELLMTSDISEVTPDGFPQCHHTDGTELPEYLCSFAVGPIVFSDSTDPQPFETPTVGSWGKPLNCVHTRDAVFLPNLLALMQRISIFQGVCTEGQWRNGAGVCLASAR